MRTIFNQANDPFSNELANCRAMAESVLPTLARSLGEAAVACSSL